MNTKAKRLAIRQALSLASDAAKVIIIEDVVSKEGKTAELSKLLAKVGAGRSTLIVVEKKTVELTRACQNLQGVKVVSAHYVNVFDVLGADKIIFSKAALDATTAWLAKETK
jgi:large subunit ribosomal protein L4